LIIARFAAAREGMKRGVATHASAAQLNNGWYITTMELIVIPIVAAIASLVTFFSGFGLGTILTPVFVIFFPIELAIALTAIVHLLNNLFKFALVGKFTDRQTLLRFGVPAIIFAFLGAWLLHQLSGSAPIATYTLLGKHHEILWVKVVIAVLMIGFTLFETIPALKKIEFDQKHLTWGGALSGFFGGLSGHQGALRSAFLSRSGLSKESFIATGVAIACLVDIVRLMVYSKPLLTEQMTSHLTLLSLTLLSAFLGAYLGSHFIKKITMDTVQKIVAIMLTVLAVALGLGLI